MMTIEEIKQHEWIVSWSGGKDSTATIILMHENNVPIKEIIYVQMMYDEELAATLPIMTDFVKESAKTFKEWGYKVRIVHPRYNLVELTNKVFFKSKDLNKNGKKYGISAITRGCCKMTSQKQKAIKGAINPSEYQMIGYAADETDRLQRLDDTHQSILATLNVIEEQTYDICQKYNLLSPLYSIKGFTRDGCWFCPNCDKLERDYMRKHYPELVDKINKLIEDTEFDLTPIINGGRSQWVRDYVKEHGYEYKPNKEN